MKKRVIFCDAQKSYPALLERYLRSRNCGLSLIPEPDPAAAYEMTAANPLCRLLICDSVFEACPDGLRRKIRETRRYCFITDNRMLPENGERIYRYSPADQVEKRLLALFADQGAAPVETAGILAPSGGLAAEMLAYLITRILEDRGIHTAGLSFYAFPAFRGTGEDGNLSRIFYWCAAGDEMLIPAADRKNLFLSVSGPSDIWHMDARELAGVLRKMKDSGAFSAIVAAIPPEKAEPALLEACSRILLVREEDYGTEIGVQSFLSYADISEESGIYRKIMQVTVPHPAASRNREEWEGILRNGSFYRQAEETVRLMGLA